MSDRLLAKRWPWITAMLLVCAVYLASFVHIRFRGDRDNRPRGTAADIEALRSRGDVNLLFILIDTLRAERLATYGYERPTSPLLDLVASRGVRFARHLAQSSWTKSSMASLWTGTFPMRSGITRFDEVIPETAKLPAEILREAGFRTAGIFRNGWVDPSFGFSQGFEVYDRPLRGRPDPTLRRENPTMNEGGTDDDVVDAAVEFLRAYGNQRWFLYLHLMDLHQYTYDEASARFGSSYSDVYDNSILHTNLVLDRLFAHLADVGLLDRTVVAIASDHGEAFGERGVEGHARDVYREVTEVPFILGLPFQLETGIVLETRTSNVDVWPTLLDLLGLPELPAADGRSRVPEMLAVARGEPVAPDAAPTFAHLDKRWGTRGAKPTPTVSVVRDGFRFVRTLEGDDVREELFDASDDASESRDRLAEQSEVAASLRELASEYLSQERAPWAKDRGTLEMDEIQLDQLRALGYAIP